MIRNWLARWGAPFTQTHADRRLGNLLGEMSGVPQEIRARSLGHTVASNDRYYKTGSYQTQIDLLTRSNVQAIDFVTALNEAKGLVKDNPDSKLLSI